MNRTVTLAASIAAILGTSTAFAQQGSNGPTIAQAAASTNNIYIAGSSAAQKAVLGALVANVCGGATNALQIASTGNGNFFDVSCTPVSGVGASNGGVYNMFYRAEGGSVAGMLPIVNSVSIDQLNLSGISSVSPSITGTSTANGLDDSFGPAGALAKRNVDLGIADVEPAALIGNNYPSQYLPSVWGPNNQAGLVNLAATQLFDEVYAFFVNENSSVFTENPLSLSAETVQQILTHKIKNWSLVTDVGGKAVTSGPLAITIVNREPGSGSRTAADLLIAGDVCTSNGGTIFNASGATQYFSTGDVLTAASGVAGSITYATIDQSKTNMVQVALNGITPGNLAAASGQYPFWVEATFAVNPSTTADTNVINFITAALQTEATAPHLVDILAIPGVPAGSGNTARAVIGNSASSAPALGSATIYVNPFTRGGQTCAPPTFVATQP